MVSRKKNSRFCPAIFALCLILCANSAFAAEIVIKNQGETVLVSFGQTWAFDQITVPSVSTRLWGKGNRCSAATMKIGNRYFVSAIASGSDHLTFMLPGISSDSLLLTAIMTGENPATETAEENIEFVAVPAQIRFIEDELNTRIDEVLAFQQQHNCFSCHTALPLALSCKNAGARGYRVNREKVTQFGDSIGKMQLANGMFNFPSHPDYGTITTTLCAGAILAMLSDYSDSYLSQLQKILDLLPGWLDKDGLTRSDFYFRPLFIGQPTSALFETLIVSTLYFRSAEDPQHESSDQLRQRLLRLGNWARTLANEPVHRRIIIMAGMPYLFQFDSSERATVINQLHLLLSNEPEGKRPDIRSLARLVMSKIAPENLIAASSDRPPQNLGEKIWLIFEQIVSFLPIKANKEE